MPSSSACTTQNGSGPREAARHHLAVARLEDVQRAAPRPAGGRCRAGTAARHERRGTARMVSWPFVAADSEASVLRVAARLGLDDPTAVRAPARRLVGVGRSAHRARRAGRLRRLPRAARGRGAARAAARRRDPRDRARARRSARHRRRAPRRARRRRAAQARPRRRRRPSPAPVSRPRRRAARAARPALARAGRRRSPSARSSSSWSAASALAQVVRHVPLPGGSSHGDDGALPRLDRHPGGRGRRARRARGACACDRRPPTALRLPAIGLAALGLFSLGLLAGAVWLEWAAGVLFAHRRRRRVAPHAHERPGDERVRPGPRQPGRRPRRARRAACSTATGAPSRARSAWSRTADPRRRRADGARLPAHRAGRPHRLHRAAGLGQVEPDLGALPPPARARADRRRALGRPDEPVHAGRAARRPHPPRRALPRPGRVHPLDGHARHARRRGRGDAAGRARDRRGRPRRRHLRDRRGRAVRDRDRRRSPTSSRSCSCPARATRSRRSRPA